MSDETYEMGGSGIDTQYERNHINYRPTIKYKKEVIDSSLYVDTASQNELGEIGSASIPSTWESVVKVSTEIDKLENTLEEKIKNISTPIPLSLKETIKAAAQKLGYNDIKDSIPFELYKKTFDSPDAPESAIIQDTYEEYMSDVDGILNGELYTDVVELKNDWVDIADFVKKGLFTQITTLDKTPKELKTDDPNLEAIYQKEKLEKEEYAFLLRLKKVNEEIYFQLSSRDYGSEKYFQAVKDMEDVRRKVVAMEKKLFTKEETLDLIDRKASDTMDNIQLIGNSVDFEPYADSEEELLYGLLKQFKAKEDMKTGLRKIQAVLKLSIDGKKEDVNELRSNLRGIAGNKSKKKINRTLVNGIHLRNQIFTDVYDIMRNFDGAPSSSTFQVMAGHITQGVEQSEKMYQNQASDFYKIHTMDTALRTKKLSSVINKNAARSVYKLIGRVLDYSKNANTAWPSEDKLSIWINDFMEQDKTT